jgi:Ni/Co efflux regulator RcnB
MKTKLLTGLIGAAMVLTPFAFAQDDQKPSPTSQKEEKRSGMSGDMRRAIEFERAKDRAAARQARIEARHPSVDRNADRVMDDKDPGRTVKDTKAPGAKKDQ